MVGSTHGVFLFFSETLEIIGNPSGFKGFAIFCNVLFCGILGHFEW